MNSYEKNLQTLIGKVEGNVNMDWSEVCDYIGADIHPDSLRKAFATTEYGGYSVAKYLMDKTANELTEDMLASLEKKKVEEYKERVRLQDARREYNKELRTEARYENLVDTMKCAIAEMPNLELRSKEVGASGVKASLMISDLHYGALIDNAVNFYNTDVCKERMGTLLNKVIKYCTIHRVKELYVNLAGDLVCGNIHLTSRVEQEEDVITQTMQVAELLANFLSELSKYVDSIVVVCVQGNHSRITPNRKESLNQENFERIVFEYIKMRLPKIRMLVNGMEDWIAYRIGSRSVFLEHGDKSSVASAREKAINLLGYVPDTIMFGHFHHLEVNDDNGTDIVVNGSVMGSDSYAVKRRLNTPPYQVMQIYDGEDVCTYKIIL
jgi:predicted phosphodiesterase